MKDARVPGNRPVEFLKRVLGHRRLPLRLAAGAILAMLPALKIGLVADDLVQRPFQFKASDLPAQTRGLFPPDTGTLHGVLSGLFGRMVNPEQVAAAKDYGVLGRWAPNGIRFGLWRPLTALMHWVDYRLFPDCPALMHAHNIAWFAAAVFLAAVIYHRLVGPAWIAGPAGFLFLADSNSYFPVMFVANRGFFVALVLGVAALYAHYRWRTTGSRLAMVLSWCALAGSLFANEGGASSFAFILVYALVLESGPWRQRALTVLPSILLIIGWRLVYQGLGYGVAGMGGGVENVGGYIDPSQEPLRFAGQLGPKMLALAGGQLTGIPPDVLLLLNAPWRTGLMVFFLVFLAAGCAVVPPLLRRNTQARFWSALMVLALIPAATVSALSKNLAFVALGAFGLVACFIGAMVCDPGGRPKVPVLRLLSWTMCVLLLVAHVAGPSAGRMASVKITPLLFTGIDRLAGIGDTPGLDQQDVILINPPLQIATIWARGQVLPKSIRALVPGYADVESQWKDENILIVQTRTPDIFACKDPGAVHLAYAHCLQVPGMASASLMS